MVKTIASILISLALLIGATVFETVFINTQFAEVRAALEYSKKRCGRDLPYPMTRVPYKNFGRTKRKSCTPSSRITTSPISTTGWAKRTAASKRSSTRRALQDRSSARHLRTDPADICPDFREYFLKTSVYAPHSTRKRAKRAVGAVFASFMS